MVLSPRNRPDDQQRLGTRNDRFRQRGIRRFMRQVLLASKEAQERTPLARDVIANRAAQHGIAGLERVEDRTQRGRALDVKLYLAADLRQRPQMRRKLNSDHGSVCTSTESTPGRSRTIGVQLSPASADTYTCPPVVPKYTPQQSSESTAMASRSTFT